MRNICFGRCCGHMIPSIHKVPACPFTALCAVSHCTAGYTAATQSVFPVQHSPSKPCSRPRPLFCTIVLFSLKRLDMIFFHNVFVTEEVIWPFQPFTVSRFNCWKHTHVSPFRLSALCGADLMVELLSLNSTAVSFFLSLF